MTETKVMPSTKETEDNTVCEEKHGNGLWNDQDVLLMDFLPQSTNVNAARYCDTLQQGAILLHNKEKPHTANITRCHFQDFHWTRIWTSNDF